MGIKKTYNINELAKEFDVTTRSVRFYEDQGLIHPTRRGQTASSELKTGYG
jgi:DNA-binding transcriptional MerR regulator